MSIYDFTFRDRDGAERSMAAYQGKVLLIVNTATGCGFTPQYADLQSIYDACAERGLEILDFPCNQFANQAPGTDEEIHTFCKGRFGITFPQFSKIDVNGADALPLFKFLAAEKPFESFGKGPKALAMKGAMKAMDKDGRFDNIKWNFTKFLVGRDGTVLARFEPTISMKEVKAAVEAAL